MRVTSLQDRLGRGITRAYAEQCPGDHVAENVNAILLLTRPVAAAQRFWDRVRVLQPAVEPVLLDVCISPLLDIVMRDVSICGDGFNGFVFTSRYGVLAAAEAELSRKLPCYCVGQTTADAARKAGWPVAIVASCADALVAWMSETRPATPLLHVSGRETRGQIAARLSVDGLRTEKQIAYDQNLLPFTDEALRVLDGKLPVIAPLFSPRTARHFAREHKGQAPLWAAALSRAVADPLETLPLDALIVAEHPDAEKMVDAVGALYFQATRVERSG